MFESPPGAAPPDPIVARLPGGRSVDHDVRTHPSARPEVSVTVALPSADQLAGLDGPDLDRVLWDLEQARRRVEAAIVAVTDRCDQTGHFAADGHRNVRGWTQAVTNCAPGEAARRDRAARVLRVLPAVRTEFAAGRVGVAQVAELTKVGANPRCADQLPGSESPPGAAPPDPIVARLPGGRSVDQNSRS